MKAPFEPKSARSQREVLLDEFRLCMVAAVGCSVVGVAAIAYHRWRGETTPLAALLVVGGFYTVMGFGRMLKYFKTPPGEAAKPGSGH